jgi:hypothetical protein
MNLAAQSQAPVPHGDVRKLAVAHESFDRAPANANAGRRVVDFDQWFVVVIGIHAIRPLSEKTLGASLKPATDYRAPIHVNHGPPAKRDERPAAD